MRVSTGKEGQEGNGAEGEEGGRELTMKQRMGESGGERWTTKGILKRQEDPHKSGPNGRARREARDGTGTRLARGITRGDRTGWLGHRGYRGDDNRFRTRGDSRMGRIIHEF